MRPYWPNLARLVQKAFTLCSVVSLLSMAIPSRNFTFSAAGVCVYPYLTRI